MQCTKSQSSAFFIRQRPQKVDPGAIIEIVDYNKKGQNNVKRRF